MILQHSLYIKYSSDALSGVLFPFIDVKLELGLTTTLLILYSPTLNRVTYPHQIHV